MIHELLDSIRGIDTESLEKIACEKHSIRVNVFYFRITDGKLEGPFVESVTKKERIPMQSDIAEWFRQREIFTTWLDNSANNAVSGNIKNYLSSNCLTLSFKAANLDKIMEHKKNVPSAFISIDKICENIPEVKKLEKDSEEYINKNIELLYSYVDKTIEKSTELAKRELKGLDTIKIFINESEEKYKNNGKKYLFCKLSRAPKNQEIIDNKTYCASTINFNQNSGKKNARPNDMKHGGLLRITLEDAYRLCLYKEILKEQTKNDVVYVRYENYDLYGNLYDDNDESKEGYKITFSDGKIIKFENNIVETQKNNFDIQNYLNSGFKFNQMPLSDAIRKYITSIQITLGNFNDKKEKAWREAYSDAIDEYILTGKMSHQLYNAIWKKVYKYLLIHDSNDQKFGNLDKNVFNTFLNIKYKNGEKPMRDIFNIKNDDDFYYSAGQLSRYLAEQSSSKTQKNAHIKNFLLLNNSRYIKDKIVRLMKKYGDSKFLNKKYNMLVAAVFGYTPKEFYIDSFIEGLYAENILLKSSNSNTDENNSEEN